MLLRIGAKVNYPDWWQGPDGSEKEFTSVVTWWDGLSWQEWQGPLDKVYYSCNVDGLISEGLCYADVGAQMVSQVMGIEWLYKMFSNVGYVVREGVLNEFYNILG